MRVICYLISHLTCFPAHPGPGVSHTPVLPVSPVPLGMLLPCCRHCRCVSTHQCDQLLFVAVEGGQPPRKFCIYLDIYSPTQSVIVCSHRVTAGWSAAAELWQRFWEGPHREVHSSNQIFAMKIPRLSSPGGQHEPMAPSCRCSTPSWLAGHVAKQSVLNSTESFFVLSTCRHVAQVLLHVSCDVPCPVLSSYIAH